MKLLTNQFILCVLFCGSAFCQEQPLNQLDSLGKKHGRWEVYLTDQWKAVSKPEEATYLWYTHYDHGTNLYKFGEWAIKLLKLTHTGDKEKMVKGLKLMNGTYTWSTRKGRIVSTHELKDGFYILYQDFKKDGRLHTVMDYSQRLWEQPHTYKMTIWDKKGNAQVFFHEKTKKWGWIAYQAITPPDSISSVVIRTKGDTIYTRDKWYYQGKLYNEVEKIYFRNGGRGFYDGMFHGKYLAWYSNGNKEHKGYMKHGKAGEGWKSWNPDGTPRAAD